MSLEDGAVGFLDDVLENFDRAIRPALIPLNLCQPICTQAEVGLARDRLQEGALGVNVIFYLMTH